MEEGLSLIQKYLEKEFSDGSLPDFSSWAYKNLTLFVTELPEHYVNEPETLNEYFETMNSTGKSLEQHEFLKVWLLQDKDGLTFDDSERRTLTRLWNKVSNFEKPLISQDDDRKTIEKYLNYIGKCRDDKYEDIFRDFAYSDADEGNKVTIASLQVEKKDFSKRAINDREEGIIDFPQFLLLVLSIHHNDSRIAGIHQSKLLETFKANGPTDIRQFYKQLIYFRLLMDLYVVRIRYENNISRHVLLFNEANSDNEHWHDRLKQFESMLEVSTEPHLWVKPFLEYINGTNNPSQEELLKYLGQLDREIHPSEVPEASDLNYDARPRYWLWRLDYALWEKLRLEGRGSLDFNEFNSEAVIRYEFRKNRSIEHLHPQNQNNSTEQWDFGDINSFGNLALISSSFNSSQSNWDVKVKFANLENHIEKRNLQSIKLYMMYLEAENDERKWTTDTMKSHQQKMLEILTESRRRL